VNDISAIRRSSATRAAAKARSAVPAYKVNQEGIHGLPALQHGTRSQLCNKLLQKSIANELGSAIRLHNANSGGFHDRLESLHKRSFPQHGYLVGVLYDPHTSVKMDSIFCSKSGMGE
jgi:hypothetical protein